MTLIYFICLSGERQKISPKGLSPKGISPKRISPKGFSPKGISPEGRKHVRTGMTSKAEIVGHSGKMAEWKTGPMKHDSGSQDKEGKEGKHMVR